MEGDSVWVSGHSSCVRRSLFILIQRLCYTTRSSVVCLLFQLKYVYVYNESICIYK